MIVLIIATVVFLVAACIIAFTVMDDQKWLPFVGAAILIIITAFICSIKVVPTGYTGILTTFGKVEDRVITSGANMVLPWQQVVKMDNRTQKVAIQTSAFSSDIQQVDLQMSVNYNIDQNTARVLYKTVGKNYYDNIIFPRIQENTKAVISKYSAENLIANRDILSDQIIELLSKDLSEYGINIVSVAIEDIDFTDAYTNAVEAKQVAAQNKLAAETQQAQKTMEEEAAAKRAVIKAQADADVVKVEADAELYRAEKEAEANKRLAESVTDELAKYNWIKQWSGELPDTVLSADSSYMIDLG